MLRKHFLILAVYTFIALVLSYPLVLIFTTAIPVLEGDAPSFVWALGWRPRALELGVNPFHTDYVFYPLGGATQLLWAVSLIGVLAMPFEYAFGVIAAHNAMYLAATVLTAYGTFLLATDFLAHAQNQAQKSKIKNEKLPPFQTLLVVQFITLNASRFKQRSQFAAFIAGLVFAFAPLRLGYGLAFFNLFNTQFIPFYILFLLRATRTTILRDAMLAGLFLGLNAYVDFQITAFLVLLTAIYLAHVLIAERREWRANLFGWCATWALTGVTSLVVAVPILFFVAQDFAREGGNYIRVFPLKYSTDRAYDALAYILPHAQSALYAKVPLKMPGINAGVNANDTSALSPDRQSFVGFAVLALAIYACVRRWRWSALWLIVALVFALSSLGPYLHFAGQLTGIPLPYLALHEIPIINHIRIPMRYGILVAFALALLAAIAIYDLRMMIYDLVAQKKSRLTSYVLRFTLLILPILILAESAILPFPTQAMTIPPIYETLAREPGAFTILEIPTFNWRAAATLEAYQPIHGKRILRAYTNRISPELADYFGYRGMPIVLRSLRVLEGAQKGPLDAGDLAEDKQVRDEVLRFFDLRYAIVHRNFLTPEQTRAVDAYLREVLGARIVADEGNVIGYAMLQPGIAPAITQIDLRELIGQIYVGRGWQFEYPKANWEGEFDFVWTRGAQAEIYFLAPDARAMTMMIHAHAESPLSANVLLNDVRVGAIALTTDWQDYRIELPASAIKPGMNRVRLDFGRELKEMVGVTTIVIQ